MKKNIIILLATVMSVSASFASEWTQLFDGKSLDHWRNPYEWGKVYVEDGNICLVANRKFFLCSKDEYKDFIFEAEVKMPKGNSNSGFMFRADVAKNKVSGYQAETDTGSRAWSGGIFGEGFGGWRFMPRKPNNSPAGQAFRTATKGSFKRHGWNKYRIECAGNRLRVFVNGTLCSDYFDDSLDSGAVALQHHGEDGKIYRFRNIRIKTIEPDQYLGTAAKVVLDEHFEGGKMNDSWTPTDQKAWAVTKQDGSGVLHLKGQSDYKQPVQSPKSIIWLLKEGPDSFVMDAVVKSTGKAGGHRDLCLFFGKQDDSHFYYVHLAPKADPRAHSVFAVDGKPRVSIVQERTDGVDWGDDWHRVRLIRNAESGAIEVYFDDLEKPIMTAKDKRFIGGSIGLGSFDNTGYFDDLRIMKITP